MIYAIIAISLWILTVVGYIIFNLYNKNKKLENLFIKQSNFIGEMSSLFKDYDNISNKIDSQIWVQSDPELLELFEKIKEIQKKSKDFIL